MDQSSIKYVLISGYVSILFGRNRSSEDIDLIIETLSFEKFRKLWDKFSEEYECLNTKNYDEAFKDYLSTKHSIRFSRKNEFIPNMEVKFPKIELEDWVLENRKEVLLNKNKLYISPIELQISFKLFLNSEKDIEDAKHLYELFKEDLDKNLLDDFNRKLKVVEYFNKYLK